MKYICKQLSQRIKYTKTFTKTLIVFLVISVATIFSGVAQMNDYTLDEFLGSFDTCTMFSCITLIAFISLTLGAEFKNKTLYYNIMGGHSRKEVFFGRFIGFLPYVLLLCVIQNVILYGIFAFMTTDTFFEQYINNVFLNAFTIIVVYLSYSVLSFTFSFISKSAIGGIGGGIIVMIAYNIIYFVLNLTNLKISSFKLSDLFGLFLFRFLLENNANVGFQFIVIALYSLLTGCYLLFGYSIFKKQDLS